MFQALNQKTIQTKIANNNLQIKRKNFAKRETKLFFLKEIYQIFTNTKTSKSFHTTMSEHGFFNNALHISQTTNPKTINTTQKKKLKGYTEKDNLDQ